MADIALSDMKYVLWEPTFKLAAARSLASAIVLTVLGLLFGMFRIGGATQALQFFVFWAIGSSIGGLFYIYMLKALSTLLAPVAGGIVTTVCTLMSYMVAVLVAAGDPLVFALIRAKPEILPVPDFGLFNLKVIIFVLDERGRG